MFKSNIESNWQEHEKDYVYTLLVADYHFCLQLVLLLFLSCKAKKMYKQCNNQFDLMCRPLERQTILKHIAHPNGTFDKGVNLHIVSKLCLETKFLAVYFASCL